MSIRLYVLTFVLAVTTNFSYADSNRNDGNADPLQKALSLIEKAPSDEASAARAYQDLSEALELVKSDYTYIEVAEALLKRLEKAVAQGKRKFARLLFNAVFHYSHITYADQVEELVDIFIDENRGHLSNSEIRDLEENSVEVRDMTGPLAGYYEVKEYLKRSARPLEQKLKEFKTAVESELKGQPEVVDLLVKLYRKDLVFKKREESESAMLMGLPGTGKDTAAMAYANALWGNKKAHEKHMFTITALKDEMDMAGVMGSGTGYIGSDKFPPLLDFLVAHSCGRYLKLPSGNRGEHKIIENPKWQPQFSLGKCPENAVLYLNEFHNWSSQNKDTIVKEALERGVFNIRNPNGGLTKITVPVTIIMGSNDGIELLSARERNGQRYGKPMSFEQIMEKYNAINNDKSALTNSILSGNGDVNTRTRGSGPGTSPELVNRIHHFILLRPLSKEHLQEVARHKMDEKVDLLKRGNEDFSAIKASYSSALLKFVQEFEYFAEDNARPLKTKVDAIVEAPFIEAVASGLIEKDTKEVEFDIQPNKDGTYSLVIKAGGKTHVLPIAATESLKERQPISDERLQELLQIEDKLNARVIGQPTVTKEIARAIFNSEEGRQGIKTVADAKEPARAFMLLGWTSTGKTETAKALADVMLGSRDAAHVIAFNPGTTEHDLKVKILGLHDGNGTCLASDFMKVYDRSNGKVIFVFDEIANVRDKSILNMLYDIFREPVVSTFCDGKERIMSNVTILVTGNAGQEILADLPSELPDVVRRSAMKEAYEMVGSDPNARREIYERYFSPAFLARVGDDRIFNYSPLDYLPAAELFQLKIKGALADLQVKDGRRGWKVSFKDEATYRKIIDTFEREGFDVREQGASIDRFVNEQFKARLREALLKNLVPTDSNVVIDFAGVVAGEHKGMNHGRNKVKLSLQSQKGALEIELNGRQVEKYPTGMKEDLVLTAFHEAGHALVTKVLFDGFEEPEYIKILPGVARISNQWIYYAGLASSEDLIDKRMDIATVINEIAVLMAGTVGEDLIVKGGTTSAGKSNDIERATRLAEAAILQYGLVKAWGDRVSDKSHLSEADLQLLAQLVRDLLKQGHALAEQAIMANADTFVQLGNALSRKGIILKPEMQKIFAETKVNFDANSDIVALAKNNEALFERSKGAEGRRRGATQFNSNLKILALNEVIDVNAELEKQRTVEIAKLKVDSGIALGGKVAAPAPQIPVSACEGLLKSKK